MRVLHGHGLLRSTGVSGARGAIPIRKDGGAALGGTDHLAISDGGRELLGRTRHGEPADHPQRRVAAQRAPLSVIQSVKPSARAELVDEAGQGFHGVERQGEQLQGDGVEAVGG